MYVVSRPVYLLVYTHPHSTLIYTHPPILDAWSQYSAEKGPDKTQEVGAGGLWYGSLVTLQIKSILMVRQKIHQDKNLPSLYA